MTGSSLAIADAGITAAVILTGKLSMASAMHIVQALHCRDSCVLLATLLHRMRAHTSLYKQPYAYYLSSKLSQHRQESLSYS